MRSNCKFFYTLEIQMNQAALYIRESNIKKEIQRNKIKDINIKSLMLHQWTERFGDTFKHDFPPKIAVKGSKNL